MREMVCCSACVAVFVVVAVAAWIIVGHAAHACHFDCSSSILVEISARNYVIDLFVLLLVFVLIRIDNVK